MSHGDPLSSESLDIGGFLRALEEVRNLLAPYAAGSSGELVRVQGLKFAVRSKLVQVDRELLSPKGRSFLRRIERSVLDLDLLPIDEALSRVQRLVEAVEARQRRGPDPGAGEELAPPKRAVDAPQRELAADFLTPIRELKGVGPVKADLLAALGLTTIADLLHHLPRDYQDRTTASPIADLEPGSFAVVAGRISAVRSGRGRRMRFLEIALEDETGQLLATWFRPPAYLHKVLVRGEELLLMGKVEAKAPPLRMSHPEFEPLGSGDGLHSGIVVPLYRTVDGLGQRALRKLVAQAFADFGADVPDRVPAAAREELGLPNRAEALSRLHFPESPEALEDLRKGSDRGHEALLWEDLFLLQLALHRRRCDSESLGYEPFETGLGTLRTQLVEQLPFVLTGGQERALAEIDKSLSNGGLMQRLVQGDVGAGKTVVALLAASALVESGRQVAVLAPTEVLAYQWWQRARDLYGSVGIEVALLTGAQRTAARKHHRGLVSSGQAKLVVGTHALFQDSVSFAALGLVIVDEQQRFGVFQRARLLDKGPQPHLLAMTATPIPRSLALCLFGDLDVSVIDELPPRGKVVTEVVEASAREIAYRRVREAAEAGDRAFIVCPRVQGPGEGRAVVETAETLASGWLRGISIGLLHGRMDASEKEEIVDRFRSGEVQVLVSTTVVEVGIDVPEATVLVVEGAQRFGLSQLHQLRGRVGRSVRDGHCLLVSEGGPFERLEILATCNDGFRIAEEDLRLRGPGDLVGTRQAGAPAFRLSTSPRFVALLDSARRYASEVAKRPDYLTAPELDPVRAAVAVRLDASAVIEAG